MKKIVALLLVTLITSCAGIRYCAQNESPATGCRAWDPATTNGASIRS